MTKLYWGGGGVASLQEGNIILTSSGGEFGWDD